MIVDDNRVLAFVSERCGVNFLPPVTALGIEKDGKIIAGVVFNFFESADVHISVAGQGWTRQFLKDVGHYVFDILKSERMTALTEQPSVVRLAERLGGKVEGCLRSHYGRGRDAFVVGFLAEEYKFR